MESNETPVDPFCIGTIVYKHETFNKSTTTFQDTVQFLCNPEDTAKLRLLFNTQRIQTCGLGWCDIDSIISLNYEYIE